MPICKVPQGRVVVETSPMLPSKIRPGPRCSPPGEKKKEKEIGAPAELFTLAVHELHRQMFARVVTDALDGADTLEGNEVWQQTLLWLVGRLDEALLHVVEGAKVSPGTQMCC